MCTEVAEVEIRAVSNPPGTPEILLMPVATSLIISVSPKPITCKSEKVVKLSRSTVLMPREVANVRVVIDAFALATASAIVSSAVPAVIADKLLTFTAPDTPLTPLIAPAATL